MKGLLFVISALFVVYVYSQAPTVQCPDNRDGNVTFAPHPCSCTTYYVCFADSAIPMPCPPDLHFNREKLVCDWPWRAKCTTNPNCPRAQSSEQIEA